MCLSLQELKFSASSRKHDFSYWQQERLCTDHDSICDPHTVNEPHHEGTDAPYLARLNLRCMTAIGDANASASARDRIGVTVKNRLKHSQNSARSNAVLNINELVCRTKLAGRDRVLYLNHHHWDDGQRL